MLARNQERLKAVLAGFTSCTTLTFSHPYRIGLNLGGPPSSQQETRELNSSWGIRCNDKHTKDEQEWPSLLIPIERRHHGTPLHKKIVCVFQQNNDFLYYLTGIRFRGLHTVWLAVIKTIIGTGNDLSKNRKGSETLGKN